MDGRRQTQSNPDPGRHCNFFSSLAKTVSPWWSLQPWRHKTQKYTLFRGIKCRGRLCFNFFFVARSLLRWWLASFYTGQSLCSVWGGRPNMDNSLCSWKSEGLLHPHTRMWGGKCCLKLGCVWREHIFLATSLLFTADAIFVLKCGSGRGCDWLVFCCLLPFSHHGQLCLHHNRCRNVKDHG